MQAPDQSASRLQDVRCETYNGSGSFQRIRWLIRHLWWFLDRPLVALEVCPRRSPEMHEWRIWSLVFGPWSSALCNSSRSWVRNPDVWWWPHFPEAVKTLYVFNLAYSGFSGCRMVERMVEQSWFRSLLWSLSLTFLQWDARATVCYACDRFR